MKNKKGISAIVATVMIILITVAAITIVWSTVIPLVRNQLETGTICMDAVSQVQVTDSAGYTCRDEAGDSVSLQITLGSKDVDLADIQVMIESGGNTQSYNLLETLPGETLPGTGESKVYIIDTSSMSGKENIESVQVAPVVSVGNSEMVCESTNTVRLRVC